MKLEHCQFCEILHNSTWPAVPGIQTQDVWHTSKPKWLYQYTMEIHLRL